MYGRRPIYLTLTLIAIATNFGSGASQNWVQTVATRVLNGIGASAAPGIGAATVCDLYFLHERGFYMGIYTVRLHLGSMLRLGILDKRTSSGSDYWRLYRKESLVEMVLLYPGDIPLGFVHLHHFLPPRDVIHSSSRACRQILQISTYPPVQSKSLWPHSPILSLFASAENASVSSSHVPCAVLHDGIRVRICGICSVGSTAVQDNLSL